MSDVYEDDVGRLYLVTLCAGIAWMRVGIVLDQAEKHDFKANPESIAKLARRMCFDFEQFKMRAIPDDIKRQIVGEST